MLKQPKREILMLPVDKDNEVAALGNTGYQEKKQMLLGRNDSSNSVF